MELFVVATALLAALVCFRVCHAQGELTAVLSVPEYEGNIWAEEFGNVPGSSRIGRFSLRPTRSAALISRNLLLTIEESPVANPPAAFAVTVLKRSLFTSTTFVDFRQLTRVTIPALDSDLAAPRLAVYRVTPAFDSQDSRLRPIPIVANRTTTNEMCTLTVWKEDNILYTATRAILENSACPNTASNFFCVNRVDSDTDLVLLDGGLIVCNGRLAGLYSGLIPSTNDLTLSYLGLQPFRERLERIISDNPLPAPGHSPKTVASALLCLVFAGLGSAGAFL